MAPAAPLPNPPRRLSDFLSDLARARTYHFTTAQVADELDLSEVAAQATIRRLKKRGTIAAPVRGFHVLVSPEHMAEGCPPAEQFIHELMTHLEAPYYVGLLSAVRYFGVDPGNTEFFQVVTEKNRPDIECGAVRVRFVARQHAAEVPLVTFDTPRGPVLVSTPEATAIDLAAYPHQIGGYETLELVLLELADLLDGEKLAELAARTAEAPWIQRLGYFLDRVGATATAEPLARFVAESVAHATPLDPRLPMTGFPRNSRWKVALNASPASL